MLKARFFFGLILGVAILLLSSPQAWAVCGSVVIDPGHGGWDSGAVGPTGFAEKTANLDIGLRVRDLLAKAGYHVIVTRTTDLSPNTPAQDLDGDGNNNHDVGDDLQARVDMANKAKAKVFVSIHNNSFGASARGTETYYWNGASSESDSARLARFIQEEVKAEAGLADRGVKSASFYVLRRTDMPAALVEGAFISNPAEEALLKSPSFRQKIAQGVYNGIRRFAGPTGPGPDEISFKLKPHTRRRVNLNAYFCDQAVGQRVTASLPITAERAMYFNSNGISGGSSSRGARSPGRVWYLAEGFTGPGFDTWVLLANPAAKTTVARLAYYADGAVIAGGTVELPPYSRRSVHVNTTLPGRSFATKVTAAGPIVVERSIYFNSGGLTGGHSSIGAQKPAASWYFAEGRTGPQSDTWLLLFNPGAWPAHVQINYMTPAGEVAAPPLDIPAHSRQSVRVNDQLPDSDVSAIILSDVKIVAERSVYFSRGGTSGGHNSLGAVDPARTWYFADGSTKSGYEEFLAVQNPNEAPATISVDYVASSGSLTSAVKIIPGRTRLTINVGDAAEAGAGKNIGLRLAADLPVVAERSIYFNTGMYKGGSDALGSTSPSKRWLFAEGVTGDGYATSLLLTNTNDSAAKVKVRFFKE